MSKKSARVRRPARRRKKGPLDRFQLHLRSRMLSGLLVIVPAGITLFILKFLYNITAGLLARPIKLLLEHLNGYLVAAISVGLFFVLLYAVGTVAAAVVGKRLIRTAERVIDRIPLVKTVYAASKQVVDAVGMQNNTKSYQSVVMVDFPRPGLKAMAFNTGTVLLRGCPEVYYKVFIPTTPNPTSGYLEFVPASQVSALDISVEDALKVIMSGGIVSSPEIEMRPATEVAAPAHMIADNRP